MANALKSKKTKFLTQEDKHEKVEFLDKHQRNQIELEGKLQSLKLECNKYEKVLHATTIKEIDDLTKSLCLESSHSPPRNINRFQSFFNDRATSNINGVLDGIKVQLFEDKILFHFLPPRLIKFQYQPLVDAILVFKETNQVLKIFRLMLPIKMSVEDLNEKYLQEGNEDIPSLLYSLQYSLSCFWSKQISFQMLQNEGFMKNSIMYHNKDFRLMTFTIKLQNNYVLEYRLDYNEASMLPYEVTYLETKSKALPDSLINQANGLQSKLLTCPFRKVLKDNSEAPTEVTGDQESDDFLFT